MNARLIGLLAGLIFGAGLGLSGMTKPSKVIGFLDLTGRWDASLAFVMVGAIGVYGIASRLILRRSAPLLDEKFHLPTAKSIDGKLLGGAALFGVGWGLAGYCPGPVIVGLGSKQLAPLVFVGAMVVGMLLHGAFAAKAPAGEPRGAEDDAT